MQSVFVRHRFHFILITVFVIFVGCVGVQAQAKRSVIARTASFVTGAFCPGVVFKADGNLSYAGREAAFADLNEDGLMDLIASGRTETSNADLVIRLNLGNGTFSQEITTTLTTTATYTVARLQAVADLNRDGLMDLVFGSTPAPGDYGRPVISIFMQRDAFVFRLSQTVWAQSSVVAQGRKFGVNAVNVADLNRDGKLDIFVQTNYAENDATTPTGVWVKLALIGYGNGVFDQAENLSRIGTEAYSLTDYDRDGVPDYRQIAVGRTTILFGSAGLSYGGRSVTLLWEEAAARAVFQVHYNDDEYWDFVCAGSATVFLGSRTGEFTRLTRTEAFPAISDLREQDLNGDGRLDWVSAWTDNTVQVQQREDDGTFRELYRRSEAGAVQIEAVQSFDVDTKLDILYRVTSSGTTSYSILQSRPDETYLRSQSVLTGVQPMAYGDFNGDGKAEVATRSGNNISFWKAACANLSPVITPAALIHLQRGQTNVTATLASVSDNETASSALKVVVRNLPAGLSLTNLTNNDGTITAQLSVACGAALGDSLLEIRVTDEEGAVTSANSTLQVTAASAITMAGYADTTMEAGTATLIQPGSTPPSKAKMSLSVSPAVSGIALDPTTGVVTVANTVAAGSYAITVTIASVCQSNTLQFTLTVQAPPPTTCNANLLPAPRSFATAETPSSVAFGDFNGDGKPDVVTSNYEAHAVSVLLNDGAGGFLAPRVWAAGGNPKSVSVGDLNNDGKLDFVVANLTSSDLSVFLGQGDGTFVSAARVGGMSYPTSIAIGDFNGDEKADLVVANSGSFLTTLLYGNGDGTFALGFEHFNFDGGMPYAVTKGDYNHDGRLDFAVAFNTKDAVGVYLNLPSGLLSHIQMFPAGNQPIAIVSADFNADGTDDVAVANYGSNNVTLISLTATTDGVAGEIKTLAVGNLPHSLVVADMNGDRLPDLLVGNDGTNFVSLWESSPSGLQRKDMAGVESPSSIAVADFNADGVADLMVADYWVNRVTAYQGACETTTSLDLDDSSLRTLRVVPDKYDGWPHQRRSGGRKGVTQR